MTDPRPHLRELREASAALREDVDGTRSAAWRAHHLGRVVREVETLLWELWAERVAGLDAADAERARLAAERERLAAEAAPELDAAQPDPGDEARAELAGLSAADVEDVPVAAPPVAAETTEAEPEPTAGLDVPTSLRRSKRGRK